MTGAMNKAKHALQSLDLGQPTQTLTLAPIETANLAMSPVAAKADPTPMAAAVVAHVDRETVQAIVDAAAETITAVVTTVLGDVAPVAAQEMVVATMATTVAETIKIETVDEADRNALQNQWNLMMQN